MSWLYAQTWLWYLIAFVVGVLLAWLFLVLPQQRRLRTLQSVAGAGIDHDLYADSRSGVAAGGRRAARRCSTPTRTGGAAGAGPTEDPATEQFPPVDPAANGPDTTEIPVQPAPDDSTTGEIPVVSDAGAAGDRAEANGKAAPDSGQAAEPGDSDPAPAADAPPADADRSPTRPPTRGSTRRPRRATAGRRPARRWVPGRRRWPERPDVAPTSRPGPRRSRPRPVLRTPVLLDTDPLRTGC